jgi:hypothetical protein
MAMNMPRLLTAMKTKHNLKNRVEGWATRGYTCNEYPHSTIGCAPAELLFQERSSYIDWLNSQARKDLSIGVEQEDPTMASIFESELEPVLEPELEALIDPRLQQEPGPGIELSGSRLNSELSSSYDYFSHTRCLNLGLMIRVTCKFALDYFPDTPHLIRCTQFSSNQLLTLSKCSCGGGL